MTSSFLGRRSRRDATSTTSPSRPRTRKNQPGRAKHSSMPRKFQPVRVFTRMSRRIPYLVRTMWFDLPGFGFNVVYERQEDGVWFPSIFGTEFRLHVGPLFFFNRTFRFRWKIRGLNMRRWRPRNGCGPGISPPSPRWKSAISISHVSWSKILPTCDLCHCGPWRTE